MKVHYLIVVNLVIAVETIVPEIFGVEVREVGEVLKTFVREVGVPEVPEVLKTIVPEVVLNIVPEVPKTIVLEVLVEEVPEMLRNIVPDVVEHEVPEEVIAEDVVVEPKVPQDVVVEAVVVEAEVREEAAFSKKLKTIVDESCEERWTSFLLKWLKPMLLKRRKPLFVKWFNLKLLLKTFLTSLRMSRPMLTFRVP